jgi:tetratricopeptide (TPR) repeat protein
LPGTQRAYSEKKEDESIRRAGKTEATNAVLGKGITRSNAAIRVTPNIAELQRSLGLLYHALGKTEKAKLAYSKALVIDAKTVSGAIDNETLVDANFSIAKTLYSAGLPAQASDTKSRVASLTGSAKKNYQFNR